MKLTRIVSKVMTCTNCKNKFSVMYEQSITVWLDPELITKLLEEDFCFTCPNCKTNVLLCAEILINCRKEMFIVNTCTSKEKLREKFIESKVIDKNGKVAPAFGNVTE